MAGKALPTLVLTIGIVRAFQTLKTLCKPWIKKNHLNLGVSGYKFDEVDGYDVWLWPDHATFPSGNDAVEIRQLYGMMMQDIFDDLQQNCISDTFLGTSTISIDPVIYQADSEIC